MHVLSIDSFSSTSAANTPLFATVLGALGANQLIQQSVDQKVISVADLSVAYENLRFEACRSCC